MQGGGTLVFGRGKRLLEEGMVGGGMWVLICGIRLIGGGSMVGGGKCVLTGGMRLLGGRREILGGAERKDIWLLGGGNMASFVGGVGTTREGPEEKCTGFMGGGKTELLGGKWPLKGGCWMWGGGP